MLALREQTVTADVLIIGGGASGMWTAARLKQLRPETDVLIVDNGPVGWGGLMAMAEGDVDAVIDGDSMDGCIGDLAYYWDGLCDQDVMRTILEHSEARINNYESFGCRFRRDGSGRLWGAPMRALTHVKKYPHEDRSCGGFTMAKGMTKYVASLGLRQMGYICITDILVTDGRACGAVGFDFHEGVLYTFCAGAVVLGGGPQGWNGIVNPGGWIDPALRAGAEARNMEFVKSTWLVRGGGNPNVFMPVGTSYELVNRHGEAFMNRYAPSLGCSADGSFTCRAMAFEYLAGNGPIQAKLTLPPGTEHTVPQELIAQFDNKEVEMGCSETLGGLATDLYGETCVPGLFAVGRTRSFEPGVYIGGFALCVTANSGYLTGEFLAYDPSRFTDAPAPDPMQYERIRDRTFSDLDRAGTVTPAQARREILETLLPNDVWLLKTERSLLDALARLDVIRTGSLAQMGAGGDLHQLKRIYDTRSTACLTELFYRASLERTESRAGHYRADYPHYDDSAWLCWQHVLREPDGAYRFRKVPVPVESYSIRPERYYSDCFHFPEQVVTH